MEKKKRIIISVGIIGVVVLALGGSYALWRITAEQTNKNVVVSDCFEVTFKEETPAINLQNIYPVLDEDGMKESDYQFTITNKCSSNVRYQVLLKSSEESTLNEKYLKVALDKKNAKVLSSIESENKTYLMKEAYLRGNEARTYTLNLWMGDYVTANDTEAMNKTYRGKVTIEAYYTTELKKEIVYELGDGAFKEGYTIPNVHTYGKVLTLPTASNIMKSEYVFDGWYDNPEFTGTPYTQIDIYNNQEVTLYAKYRRPKILYDGAGATYNYNEVYYPTWEGENITLSNDVRFSTYTFEGWYLDNTYTKKVTEITKEHFQTGEDLNLYVKWNVITDLWYYDANTTDKVENMPESQIFIQGVATTVSSKIPTREGYTFVGWGSRGYTDLSTWNVIYQPNAKFSTSSTTLKERTFKAIWKKKGDFTVGGLQYIINEDNTVSITGRTTSTTEIDIPSTVNYDGKTYQVKSIEKYAFINDKTVKTVTMEEGIESLELGSFASTTVEKIQFANSIKTIRQVAFKNCGQLTELIMPEELITIDSGAFSYTPKLNKVTLNDKLKTINDAVFASTKVYELTLPDSVEKFDIQHSSYKELHIGKNLKTLNVQLSENAIVTISPENTNFKTQDNYLLSTDGKTLYGYFGSWENVVIPNGVEKLNRHSLSGIITSNPIVLPEGVKSIDYRVFASSTSPEVNIPASVISINSSAFELTQIKTIKIYKPNGSISNSPWGSSISDIQWLG